MATYSDPKRMAEAMRRRGAGQGKALHAAVKGAMADAHEYATNTLLAGTLSTKELARRGHPYARRYFRPGGGRPRVPTPIRPINRQSGDLIRSGRVVRRFPGGGATSYALTYGRGVAYARYQIDDRGTRLMIGRGARKAMREHMRPIIRRRVGAAMSRVTVAAL